MRHGSLPGKEHSSGLRRFRSDGKEIPKPSPEIPRSLQEPFCVSWLPADLDGTASEGPDGLVGILVRFIVSKEGWDTPLEGRGG
jgi:hypothetical protein